MTRDDNSKVTFYADADVKEQLDRLDPGTKSHTINRMLRKGFEGGATMNERLEVMDAKIGSLEAESLTWRKPMFDKELHANCSEFYRVDRALEVVVSRNGQPTTVRIEALRNDETGRYSTAAYLEEHVTLQPTYPQSHGNNPYDFVIWARWIDFPWIDRESADAALRQALGFLRERCDAQVRS